MSIVDRNLLRVGQDEQIAGTRATRWRTGSAEAIGSSNDYVDRNGLILAHLRQFHATSGGGHLKQISEVSLLP